MLPPTVPRERICGWPTSASAARDQGCGLGHERVALGLALAHGGADDELVALAGDLVQAGNAAQVDQQLGRAGAG